MPASFRRKLLALGVTPGAQLEVVRFAPLGDPMEIKIRGFSLSLRKHEAQVIQTTALQQSTAATESVTANTALNTASLTQTADSIN